MDVPSLARAMKANGLVEMSDRFSRDYPDAYWDGAAARLLASWAPDLERMQAVIDAAQDVEPNEYTHKALDDALDAYNAALSEPIGEPEPPA